MSVEGRARARRSTASGPGYVTQFVGADAAGRTTTTVVPSPDLPVSPLLPLLPSMPWLPVAPVLPSLPCMPVAPCGPAGPGTATAGPGTSTTGPGTATAGPGTATTVGGAFTTVGLSQAAKLNGTSSAAIHIERFIGNPFVSTGSAWNGFESVASNLSRISVLPSGPWQHRRASKKSRCTTASTAPGRHLRTFGRYTRRSAQPMTECRKPGSMLGVLALIATVGRAAAQPRRTSSAPGVGHAAEECPSARVRQRILASGVAEPMHFASG